MLDVRAARPEEFETVMNFYYDLTDRMMGSAYEPGWEKDVYPTRDFVRQSIENGELYVGFLSGEAPACAEAVEQEQTPACVMVINHETTDGYETVDWPVKAAPEEVLVIHALGVHPGYQGRGLGKRLAAAAIDICRGKGARAIRLDVLGNNLPARKLYPSMGFQYITTRNLFYKDTGLTDFLLYELPLSGV